MNRVITYFGTLGVLISILIFPQYFNKYLILVIVPICFLLSIYIFSPELFKKSIFKKSKYLFNYIFDTNNYYAFLLGYIICLINASTATRYLKWLLIIVVWFIVSLFIDIPHKKKEVTNND